MAPSHYLNYCWNIVDWTLGNKVQWNFNPNSKIFIQENAFENVICEIVSICLGLNVLSIHGKPSSSRECFLIDIHVRGLCWWRIIVLPYYYSGGRFKNTYELLNQRALKFSYVNKIHIFQCMGKILCVEFQRYPLKFHPKYLTHTLKDMIFMQFWNFKSS